MMAQLENGVGALAFASGMAAITAVTELLQPGDEVLVHADIYGGTWRLFEQVKARSSGICFRFINLQDIAGLETAFGPKTRVIWLETPTNPMLGVLDIRAISAVAKQRKVLTVVDNTFATPYLQKPLSLGADIVVHSATKYLNGHSDALGGIVISADKALHDQLAFVQKTTGAILSPFDSFLILRGIKTLALRMQAHCAGALQVANALAACKEVAEVIYPGLPSYAMHHLARRLMPNGFGGVVSFRLHNAADVRPFLERLQWITVAESLGGVESLIAQPSTMTHVSIPEEKRLALGIDGRLVRLSVGIESPSDLITDLLSALKG